MLVPGMQQFIIQCFRNMRFPWKCFGIESPIIRNVRFEEDLYISFGTARGAVPLFGFEGSLTMVDEADCLGMDDLLGSFLALLL